MGGRTDPAPAIQGPSADLGPFADHGLFADRGAAAGRRPGLRGRCNSAVTPQSVAWRQVVPGRVMNARVEAQNLDAVPFRISAPFLKGG
jgi:hypothetical protein